MHQSADPENRHGGPAAALVGDPVPIGSVAVPSPAQATLGGSYRLIPGLPMCVSVLNTEAILPYHAEAKKLHPTDQSPLPIRLGPVYRAVSSVPASEWNSDSIRSPHLRGASQSSQLPAA